MGYTKNVVSGFSWHTALKFTASGIAIAKIAVLARLLTPRDFGLFSLITIALGLVEATTETGVNLTILQSKHSIKYFLNTAWVIAIVRGLLIGVLMAILGLIMGNYFNEPSLPILIALAALIPCIKGLINPAIISWRKNLQFFRDSAYHFLLLIVEATLAVTLAYTMRSVTGLVFALVGTALFEVMLSFMVLKSRPIFQYIPNRAKIIFSNTKGLSLNTAFNYLNENLDNLLIGRILGTTNLGYYHNAYALGHKPNYDFAKATHHGTISVFPKMIHDLPRLKKAWWRASTATGVLIVVATLPVIFLPELVVKILLGEQWLPIVPIVPILGFAGLLQSATMSTYSLFLATKQYLAMNAHLISMVLIMAGLLLTISPAQGLTGAAWAIVMSRLVTIPLLVWGVRRIFN